LRRDERLVLLQPDDTDNLTPFSPCFPTGYTAVVLARFSRPVAA